MIKSYYIVIICFLIGNASLWSQQKIENTLIVKDSIKKVEINPLAPAKAAFYSAVIPGLGQVYNKKYWKIPLVYAGLGAGIYYYTWNQKKIP